MNPNSDQNRISFGYNRAANGEIVINGGQAATVKLIYIQYLEGNSIAAIKGFLESIGVPTAQNKPKWGKQAIANILSNHHYLGSDVYPQIISSDDFNRVQEMKKSK